MEQIFNLHRIAEFSPGPIFAEGQSSQFLGFKVVCVYILLVYSILKLGYSD
jgi:hypothetical protein